MPLTDRTQLTKGIDLYALIFPQALTFTRSFKRTKTRESWELPSVQKQ